METSLEQIDRIGTRSGTARLVSSAGTAAAEGIQ